MGLFWEREIAEEVEKLKKEVEKLRDRVWELEVGTKVPYYVLHSTPNSTEYFEHRTIGVADAVELLVDHLGLTIQEPSSTKAKIVKKKAKKSKK